MDFHTWMKSCSWMKFDHMDGSEFQWWNWWQGWNLWHKWNDHINETTSRIEIPMWVESIIQMQFPYGNIPHQWKLKNVFDHKKTKCMKLTKRW